ncbi:MAG: imidazole glycerol phosphate synthase subunit HisH [Candidatus Caenarcaniphilales bacterium]|nr:imidazole glycerol phosphate synthase subunit HisH [Candidatus Caenarcaniphilales bacterium]
MSQILILKSDFANLYSVENALRHLGYTPLVSDRPNEIKAAGALILPGVGYFEHVYDELLSKGLFGVIVDELKGGKPFLGICLGMQLLFECSYEGDHPNPGFGLLEGQVIPIPAEKVSRIPQIGWNELQFNPALSNSPLKRNLPANSHVYFDHSYYCDAQDKAAVLAWSELVEGFRVPVIVQKDNLFGVQFHPERSSTVGLQILKNFIEYALISAYRPSLKA